MDTQVIKRYSDELKLISAFLLRSLGIWFLILASWFIIYLGIIHLNLYYLVEWLNISETEFVTKNITGMMNLKLLGYVLFLVPFIAIQLLLSRVKRQR